MKILRRSLIWFLILIFVLYLGPSLYVQSYGKDLIEKSITKSLDKKASIQAVRFRFPNVLHAKKLFIEDTIAADDVYATLSMSSLVSVFVSQFNKKPVQLTLRKVTIKNGNYQYTTKSYDKDLSLTLKNFRLDAKDLVIPLKSVQTQFDLSGKLDNSMVAILNSDVRGKGWINFLNKDMDAQFASYDDKGQIILTANAKSVANDMEVSGYVKSNLLKSFLKDIKDEKAKNMPLGDFILDGLMAIVIDIQYSFKINLNDFRISNISFSGRSGGK